MRDLLDYLVAYRSYRESWRFPEEREDDDGGSGVGARRKPPPPHPGWGKQQPPG